MAPSSPEQAHDVRLDSRVDLHTHIHTDENLQNEDASTKPTEVVATKVSAEVHERILAVAQSSGVTRSCLVRRLLMRALAQDEGNLDVFDSRRERRL